MLRSDTVRRVWRMSTYPSVDRFWIVAYKPTLEEVEKILAEAGLDEEEMRKGATGTTPSGEAAGLSRNRR